MGRDAPPPPAEARAAALVAEPAPVTVVTLGFDDGRDQAPVRAILADPAHGFVPATFYLNSDRLGASGYLDLEQAQVLAADGHEIASHALGHTRLTDLTFDQARALVCDDRDALQNMGFTVKSFAYPFGADNPNAQAAVASCLDSARDVGGVSDGAPCATCAETLPPLRAFAVRSPSSLTGCPSAEDMEAFVDRAIAGGGGWLHLIFHHVVDDPAQCGPYTVLVDDLAAFVTWLRQREDEGAVVIRTHGDVVGLPNPSYERPEAGAEDRSDCWDHVFYRDVTGSFSRVADAHSGATAERIELTSLVNGNLKLVTDRYRPECWPRARAGHVYRLSAWYKFVQTGPEPAPRVRFIVYYRSFATGEWIYFEDSPSFGPTEEGTWTPMVWDSPAVPADATALRIGVYLKSPGVLTIDDMHATDIGPPR